MLVIYISREIPGFNLELGRKREPHFGHSCPEWNKGYAWRQRTDHLWTHMVTPFLFLIFSRLKKKSKLFIYNHDEWLAELSSLTRD